MKQKIAVFPRFFSGARGYDLLIRDPGASVQDYLDALNPAIESLPLQRTRRAAQNCRGCEGCCAERAPLTVIDFWRLREAVGEKSPEAFFNRYTTVIVQGPVVDIVLRRDEDGRCAFLDRKTKLCRIYGARPFVCQTFVCSPASRRALALREAVVNSGEDELVRLWFRTGAIIHQGQDPRPNRKDWPPTPFAGKKRYREVLLREVLPAPLWRRLTALQ